MLVGMEGAMESCIPCTEALAVGSANPSPRLCPRPSLLLPVALEEREARSSELLRDPRGSLQAWLAILVMLLTSLLEMISGLLPCESTLMPRRREGRGGEDEEGGWGGVFPSLSREEGCAGGPGCKQEPVNSKG